MKKKLKIETLDNQIKSTQTVLDQLVLLADYMESDRPLLLELIKSLETGPTPPAAR